MISSLAVDDAHEVTDLLDHATHGRRILERAPAAELVEAEADQRLLLGLGPAVRGSALLGPPQLPSPTPPPIPSRPRGLAGRLGIACRAVAAARHDLAHLLAAPR